METIRFHAVVDQERVIHPPVGITLPKGAIEVTVCHLERLTTPEADPLASAWHWLLTLAAEAEQAAPCFPSDMAEYHDHYAHGKPLP